MKKLLLPVVGIAICAHFLSACTDGQKDRSVDVAPLGASKNSTGSSSASSKKNKVIIADLESYKKYIAPIIDHIKEDEPGSFGLVRSIAEHSWYVSDLNKGKQASYIIATMRTKQKKQLAWHSKHAIFFDTTAVSVLEDKEKAELVLTQMLMSVYIKTNDIKSRSDVTDDKNAGKWDEQKEYRFFDDEDLEKIQAATEFLLEKGAKADIEEIRDNLKENKIIE